MAFPWAAAIQGGTGIGGTLIAGRQNKKAWQRSVKHEQAIFERDSEYNSPFQQMERLKAAGLNPNLMYGQGTVGNTSGTPVKSESFLKGAEPFMQMAANAFTDGLMFAAELRKRNNEADLVGKKIGTEELTQDKLSQAIKIAENEWPELLDQLKRENRIGNRTQEYQVNMTETRMQQEWEKLWIMTKERGLLDKDGKIKDEILRTKEGQNAILEIQRKFLADGDLSPGQILKLIALILIGKTI